MDYEFLGLQREAVFHQHAVLLNRSRGAQARVEHRDRPVGVELHEDVAVGDEFGIRREGIARGSLHDKVARRGGARTGGNS